jgi:breast cancer 2 susceptibility protein
MVSQGSGTAIALSVMLLIVLPKLSRPLLNGSSRYERELNRGERPPLRKIAAQDAPPSVPMILCVSNVFWSGGGMTEDEYPTSSTPELEVTDGWYRLRAQVDAPLARAIQRRKIKVGSKISIANAKVRMY